MICKKFRHSSCDALSMDIVVAAGMTRTLLSSLAVMVALGG